VISAILLTFVGYGILMEGIWGEIWAHLGQISVKLSIFDPRKTFEPTRLYSQS
jgi:hypothetical protein